MTDKILANILKLCGCNSLLNYYDEEYYLCFNFEEDGSFKSVLISKEEFVFLSKFLPVEGVSR